MLNHPVSMFPNLKKALQQRLRHGGGAVADASHRGQGVRIEIGVIQQADQPALRVVDVESNQATAAKPVDSGPQASQETPSGGQQTADDFQWQQVQTDTGLVGWVAVDYITLNEP